MSGGFLRAAQAAGIVEMVGMFEVKFMRFHEGHKTTMGADGLGGCSVVIIASDQGGIMAHIPPNSALNDPDPQSYIQHTKTMMDRVGELYKQHEKSLTAPTSNYVICAVYQSKVAVPEQKDIMTERVASIAGTSASEVLYVIEDGTSYGSNPAKGTVWLDGRSRSPRVYVEDREVSRTTAQASAIPAAAQSSTATATTHHSPISLMSQSSSTTGIGSQETSYWFFRAQDSNYCYCQNAQVTWSQTSPPLDQWVWNPSGWHGNASQVYMKWDGTQVEYR